MKNLGRLGYQYIRGFYFFLTGFLKDLFIVRRPWPWKIILLFVACSKFLSLLNPGVKLIILVLVLCLLLMLRVFGKDDGKKEDEMLAADFLKNYHGGLFSPVLYFSGLDYLLLYILIDIVNWITSAVAKNFG